MKKKVLFGALVLTCILFCSCSQRDAAFESGESLVTSSQAEESDISSEGSSLTPSAPLEERKETEQELNPSDVEESEESLTDFKKIQIGINADFEYGVFALDFNGNLYFGADSSTMDLVETAVKDFSYSASSLYVLKENGDVLFDGYEGYNVGQPLTLFYHDDDAKEISNSIVVMSDGCALNYQSETEEWNPIDVKVSKIDADYFGAAIIDVNNTLWYMERSTGELKQIAENVIDCSYRDRNKVYHSSDIWYITSDHMLHNYQVESQTDTTSSLPDNVINVVGHRGRYLAQQENGSLLIGSLTDASTDIGQAGKCIDLFGEYYAFTDDTGEIHLEMIN